VAAPSEWEARSRRLFSGAGQERARELVLSYALLLSKEFKAAEPLLENIYSHSGPEPQETMPVLLAWARIGKWRYRKSRAADCAQSDIERSPG